MQALASNDKTLIRVLCWLVFRGCTLGPLALLSRCAISCNRRESIRLFPISRVALPIPDRVMKRSKVENDLCPERLLGLA
jgi:hypothetical protein